jgi:hypothetical protein
MGDKIRDIGILRLNGGEYNVEINSPANAQSDRVIHIHGNEFRCEMSDREFYELGSAIMLAARQLARIKKIQRD